MMLGFATLFTASFFFLFFFLILEFPSSKNKVVEPVSVFFSSNVFAKVILNANNVFQMQMN